MLAAQIALCCLILTAAFVSLRGLNKALTMDVGFNPKNELGAQGKQIISAALGRMLVLLGCGSVAGLLLGVAASQILSAVVYQASAPGSVRARSGGVNDTVNGWAFSDWSGAASTER